MQAGLIVLMDLILPLLIAFTIGYLVGSVPFGLIFTRFAGHGDIRQIGSGNIGATNVLRTGNKALAAATLAGDVLKGVAACMIGPFVAWYAANEAWQAMPVLQTAGPNGYLLLAVTSYVAGLGAFIGHIFPVWLGFKGGKGVATYIGVLIGACVAGGPGAFAGSGWPLPCSRAIPRSRRWLRAWPCRWRRSGFRMRRLAVSLR